MRGSNQTPPPPNELSASPRPKKGDGLCALPPTHTNAVDRLLSRAACCSCSMKMLALKCSVRNCSVTTIDPASVRMMHVSSSQPENVASAGYAVRERTALQKLPRLHVSRAPERIRLAMPHCDVSQGRQA